MVFVVNVIITGYFVSRIPRIVNYHVFGFQENLLLNSNLGPEVMFVTVY